MHLFSGIKADLDLSTPLASRTPELVSYIEVVLEVNFFSFLMFYFNN